MLSKINIRWRVYTQNMAGSGRSLDHNGARRPKKEHKFQWREKTSTAHEAYASWTVTLATCLFSVEVRTTSSRRRDLQSQQECASARHVRTSLTKKNKSTSGTVSGTVSGTASGTGSTNLAPTICLIFLHTAVSGRGDRRSTSTAARMS